MQIYTIIAYTLTPLTSWHLRIDEIDQACPTGGLKGKTAPVAMPTLAAGAFLVQKPQLLNLKGCEFIEAERHVLAIATRKVNLKI